MTSEDFERTLRRVLIALVGLALVLGVLLSLAGLSTAARVTWGGGTAVVAAALLVFMVRDLLAGRLGVDSIAFVSMCAAVALG